MLGFQAGTVFVIYGVWIPAFFTLGVTYVLLFDRLADRTPTPTDGAKRVSMTSLMPEGLFEALTPEERRNLVGYLMGTAQVPLPAR